MITANVINRVINIKTKGHTGGTGTAFIVEHKRKSYIVTARHLVHDQLNSIDVRCRGEWHPQAVRLLGVGDGDIDVAVLAYRDKRAIPPYPPVILSAEGMTYAQTAYFLGYPYEWDGGSEELRNGFAIPFVKAGIISKLWDSSGRMWLDAHGNEGFSGGPVAFQRRGSTDWNIGGVVTALMLDPTDSEKSRHAGFVVAEDIASVIRVIETNPDGVPVSS